MSWRGRNDDNRGSRWGENRGRSPVWEGRRSATPDRVDRKSPPRHHRDRYDRDRDRDRDRHGSERDRHGSDRDRRDRHSRESDRYRRDRSDRPRERSRDRERRRVVNDDVPAPPSPPTISDHMSVSRSRSNSHEHGEKSYTKEEEKDDNQAVSVSPGDWFCTCGSYNFKRRQVCYRRNCFGKRSEGVVYGSDGDRAASDAGITKRLLFRRLDALTTEEKILDTIKERCSKKVLDSIAGITIGRETLTGASKCLAYINFNSIADSTAALSELVSLEPPLEIDGRDVLISFYNEPHKPPKHQQDYSGFYSQMASYGSSNAQVLSESDRANAAAAVVESAISAAQARSMTWAPVAAPAFVGSVSSIITNIPTGDGKTVYTAPDVRTFLYDETSGYYYDSNTGLYYDGTTQYFYNNQTNQYMYWEATSNTYVSATQSQQNTAQPKLPNPPQATVENTITKEPEEKKKKEKEDKVKVAKKIAKDMERWAKTLNQKKENARSNVVMEQPLDIGSSKGSADIGFSVLGAAPVLPQLVREVSPPPAITDEFLMKNVPETPIETDEGIIDWTKLTCLICKRRFPSIEVLTKHKLMSDLHKQNLAEFQCKNDMMPQTNGYRDRAAERRMKFGEDEPIITKRRYEPPSVMPPPMPAQPPPAVIDTIGGKMLQKMGWSAGRGLGKAEQGRIAPIEAEQRPSLAGLGQKKGIYTPTPGETYRDTVKKLMIARYKEVVGQDE